jgi:hypothetical protein
VDDIPTSWDQQYLEHLMQQDQTTRYLYLFEQVMKEIQSPSLPLFIPCTTKISKRKLSTIRLQLQVNAQLLSPQVLTNLQVKDTQVLEWYYRLGQLFGIAWRSKLLLPLQYLSLDFWNELVLLSSSGSSSSSNNNNRLIDAIRKGLFTIIPSRCVALLKGNQLRGILSANDLMFVSIIKQNAKYDPTQGHLQHFWQVVENFSSIERKHFFSFITGGKWTTLSSSLTTVVSFSHQDNEQEEEEEKDEQLDFIRHFQLELSEPLVDAIEHPDACFPVLEITTEHHAKLYVPIYSNDVILRKKLVLAMMSTETGFGSPTGFSPLTVGTKNSRGNIGS